jgi:AcrR family transcriptional regulator
VSDDELFERLVQVFRVYGFEGASLGALAEGAGLQRASLYHRFPGGKVQMAESVMEWVRRIFVDVLEPMRSDPDVHAGVVESGRRIAEVYAGGALPCVLNTLTLSGAPESVRAAAGEITAAWIDAMAAAAARAGASPEAARTAAEEAFVRIEGSLVLSRLSGDMSAFQRVIDELPGTLLGGSQAESSKPS